MGGTMNPHQTGSDSDSAASERISRRQTLAALGGTVAVGAGVTGSAAASSHDAEVANDGAGGFVATNGGREVYRGGDFIAAIQAAVDSLTPGRTAKETVRVTASGDTGTASGGIKAVDLPSYTVLDVRGTINVTDSGDNLIVPVRATDAQAIEIPELHVTGNPRYGVWLRSCTDVQLGTIDMSLSDAQSVGLGVRIDDSGSNGRSQTVTLEQAFVEGSTTHAVETYGVDDLTVGRVWTRNTGGCGLLLNDTANATVENVVALNPDSGGGYAAFRIANGAGPNITVEHVTCRGGARGFFSVSGSHGCTVQNVHIVETEVQGILVQDSQNVQVNGGVVRNCTGDAVRLDSRDSGDHPATENVTIQNLRVADVRSSKQQTYGIRETGPGTANNTIQNNDLRDGGTSADLSVYAGSTTVSGNVTGGSTNLLSGGTYRIRSVNSGLYAGVANASTADGGNVVQQADDNSTDQQWEVTDLGAGEYELRAVHSDKSFEVDQGSVDRGTTIQQWADNDALAQEFRIIDRGNGEYSIENTKSGLAADVLNQSTAAGANILQWSYYGGAHQRWTFEPVDGGGSGGTDTGGSGGSDGGSTDGGGTGGGGGWW